MVVAGTVSDQRTVTDINPRTEFTLSTLNVTEVHKGELVEIGHTLEVRQIGSTDQAPPAPLLSEGSTYLLYLTESGLEGDLADQFYVTGGNAGLYEAVASLSGVGTQEFQQMQSSDGEDLPRDISSGAALTG